jgi:TPR-GreAB-C-PIN type conflict system protein
LTRTAIITIERLDLFGLFAGLNWSLLVPQSLLVELDDERRELAEHAINGRLSIESTETGPAPLNIPADVYRSEIERFDRMRSWIDSHCSVEARPLSALGVEDEKMRDVLGNSSFDSVALAKERKATLYADDSGLRRLLPNGASQGFSTFAFVGSLLDRNRIDQGRHDGLLGRLLLLNHQHLVLTPRACRVALELLDYKPRGPLLRFFERLRATDLKPVQVVTFCVGLLREVATTPGGLDHLPALTLALADVTVGGRPLDPMVQLLRVAVEGTLALLPVEKDAVLACITRFAEGRRRAS